MPDAPKVSEIPEIAEIDELQTFVGKKNKLWIWTAVNHWKPGIERVGTWRPLIRNIQTFMENLTRMAILSLCNRWLCSLSLLYQ